MALKQNTFEGGTNSTALQSTPSNNTGGASGDAFNLVTINPGDTCTFTTAQKMHGTVSLAVSGVGPTHVDYTGLTATQIAVRFYVRFSALPAASVRIMDVRTNTASVARVSIDSSNRLVFQTNNGTTTLLTTTAISASTWYRVEVAASNGTTGATLSFDYYAGDSGTPVASGYFTNAGNSGTTSNITQVFFGYAATTTFAGTMWLDDTAISDGTLTYIGIASQPPTASFTTSVAALALTVNGTGSSAVNPATITSYDWNWGDATTHGTGSTPAAHTYAAAGTYTVTLTVTDSTALQGTLSTPVTVAPASGNVSVQSISVSTGWTASSGTVLSVITDGDPSTFITSNAPPTAQEFTFIFGATVPPASGQPFKVFLTTDAPLSSSASLQAQLYDGATLRSTLTGQAIAFGSGSSVVNQLTVNFPWSDVSAMTTGGWNAPKVKLLITAA